MKRNLNPPMKRALRLKKLFLAVCFLLIGTTAFSQERTVTGVVTDSFKTTKATINQQFTAERQKQRK